MKPSVHTASEPVELLPCPFCGEAVHIRKGVNGYSHCKTEGCHASRAHIVSLDDQKQVAAWNRRAMLTAAPVREEGGAFDPQIIKRLQAEADDPGIADSVMVFGPDLRALLRAYAALATREEAPAEGGEDAIKAACIAWHRAKGSDPFNVLYNGAWCGSFPHQTGPERWAFTVPAMKEAIAAYLRAQPQARAGERQ